MTQVGWREIIKKGSKVRERYDQFLHWWKLLKWVKFVTSDIVSGLH